MRRIFVIPEEGVDTSNHSSCVVSEIGLIPFFPYPPFSPQYAKVGNMRLFLSWSGVGGKTLARELRDWIPTFLHAVEPWMSEEDIQKGARWAVELARELEKTNACIVCVTPENVDSNWMHFEVGAAAKALEMSLVCPYLLGVTKANLAGPFAQFQAANANREDTFKMLQTLNVALGDRAVRPQILERTFERFWPDLDSRLSSITFTHVSAPVERSAEQILEEVLASVRRSETTQAQGPQSPTSQCIVRDSVVQHLQQYVAYELSRGGGDGTDPMEHWLRAEAIVSHIKEIVEKG